MKNSFIEKVEIDNVRGINIIECSAFELDLEVARNIFSMFEAMKSRHPTCNAIACIINGKIKIAELRKYDRIKIDYETAQDIIQYIKSYLELSDDDLEVFDAKSISSYKRLIDAVNSLESRF